MKLKGAFMRIEAFVKKERWGGKWIPSYLSVIFMVLFEALYVESPVNLIFAVYLPFLVNFKLNLATPLAFVFEEYVFPLTVRLTFCLCKDRSCRQMHF